MMITAEIKRTQKKEETSDNDIDKTNKKTPSKKRKSNYLKKI